MADLPVNRTEASTIQEHEDDHNALHAFHNLIDAAGDLIVGIGPDTAGRLAKGAALTALRVNAAGTALEYAAPASTILQQSGEPGSPTTGDLWLDTDAVPASGTTVAARQGGSSTDWTTAGTTTYTPDPTKTRVQAGVVDIPSISAGNAAGVPGQGQVTVTFPISYANPPVVTVTNFAPTVNGAHWSRVDGTPTATSFLATVMNQSTSSTSTSKLAWIAVGEIA